MYHADMMQPLDTTNALEHLIGRIRAAAAHGTQLCIRGGGSKDFYGRRDLTAEVLDTRSLSGIVAYEPSELVITAQAGTPLQELEALLAEKGQCLAFEPPHFGDGKSTVGGMVAAGLSGPARASAGAVREFVLGLHMVNGRGESLQFGGQVMKNVAGYDVSRMMVGSMGTLGLITQVSLKVLPVAPAEATLIFALPQNEALECLHHWGGKPLPLNASYWVDDTLYVRLRGAVAAVESACQRLLSEHTGLRMENSQAQPEWERCRHQKMAFFTQRPSPLSGNMALWRVSVPQTAPALSLPWPQLVEWHGGLRWFWAPVQDAKMLQIMAHQLGGSATLFIAANAQPESDSGYFSMNDPALQALVKIQHNLKQSLDPQGIFGHNAPHAYANPTRP
ncbi:MAG: glycolate oxidase subunit GlcE [Pseudomonadota bacterium]